MFNFLVEEVVSNEEQMVITAINETWNYLFTIFYRSYT